jgi:superfamily II DNA/RNA helicase
VFARTKIGVEKLAARLREAGYSAVGLQGNLTQRNRDEVMAAFRYKKVRIMVATNVGARGLDVHGISHVINYDVPESAELFTHRAGRTGRNGKSGTAITFLTGEDRGKWREIEAHLNSKGVEFHQKAWDGPRSQPEFNSHSRPAKNSFDFPPKDKNTNREHPNYSRKKSQDRPEKPWYL